MAKLGYTFYPKDWGNSESVFELNLSERGLYRELIDLAMLNDNKTEIKLDVWSRKFAIDIEGLNSILSKLSLLHLIEINGEKLFIPSCESRLKLVRGGSNGGKKSKPTSKPTSKHFESLDEKNEKPIAKQIEIEREIESNVIINKDVDRHTDFKNQSLNDEIWKESLFMQKVLQPNNIEFALNDYNTHLIQQSENKNSLKDYKSHFVNWVKKRKDMTKKTENKDRL